MRARAPSDKEICLSEATFLSDPLGLKELFTLPAQLPQFLIIVVFMFGGIYFNCCVQVYLQLTMGDFYKKGTVLYDFLFEILPSLAHKSHWCDGIVFALNFGMLARFGVLAGPRSLRITILRRWMTCFGLLYWLRGFTMFCTVLPNPDDTCVPRLKYPDNIWREAIRMMQYKDTTCQDVLYSGHTVNITLACCFWITYSRHAPLCFSQRGCTLWLIEKRLVPILFAILGILSYFFIIATRFHYSVDVFLGSWLSMLVFWGYHQTMCVAAFRLHRPFHRLIGWLERGAPDQNVWLQVEQTKAD